MPRYPVFSAWRMSGNEVHSLLIESEEGAGDFKLVVSGTKTLPGQPPQPLKPFAATERQWRRIGIHHKQDRDAPQLVLDTVGWSDCSITFVGPTDLPSEVQISVRGRALLGTALDHEVETPRFFVLDAKLATIKGKGTTFSTSAGDLGELRFQSFKLTYGNSFVPKQAVAQRTLSDIIADEVVGLYSGEQSVFPVALSALGVPWSAMVGKGTHDALIDSLRPHHPWATSLDDASGAISRKYKGWVTSNRQLGGMRFGLRRIVPGSPKRPVARYGFEFRIPVGVRRPRSLRRLGGLAIGPPQGFADGVFFTLHRLVQRTPTDLMFTPFPAEQPAHWIVEIEGVSEDEIWRLWNDSLLPERLRAIRAVEGALAVSPLPSVRLNGIGHLRDKADAQIGGYPIVLREFGWRVTADLFDATGKVKDPDQDAFVDASLVSVALRGFSPMMLSRAGGPKTPLRLDLPKPANAESARVHFPVIRRHDGAALELPALSLSHIWPDELNAPDMNARVEPEYDTGDEGLIRPRMRDNAPLLHTELVFPKLTGTVANEWQTCAIGAFDLSVPSKTDLKEAGRRLTLTAALIRDEDRATWRYRPRLEFAAVPKQVLATAVEGELPLAGLAPGSQELSASALAQGLVDRDELALLVPARGEVGVRSDGLVLQVIEFSPDFAGQLLRERPEWGPLMPGGRTELARFLRFTIRQQSDEPLRLGRIVSLETAPFLVASFEIEASPVKGDGKSDANNVIAEARQDFSQRLNWKILKLGKIEMRLPPQAIGEAMEKSKAIRDIEEGKEAEIRFGPPTVIRLDPEDRAKALVELPWNARRLLSKDDGLPGVAIDELWTELLYGLSLHIEPPFVDGIADKARSTGLRLTSIDATVGQPPAFQAKSIGEQDRWRVAWRDIERRWRGRLDTLEVLDPAQPGGLLRRQGVTATLRPEADLRYPVAGIKSSDQRPEQNAPFKPDGLAGGVGWPFESVNIYEAVWRPSGAERTANGPAEIANLYLSALGGWAQQKASFDEGRTAIYSRVGMGRTHYICVERRGRIGVLWHPAKHIIIYERTVLPTEQFADGQDAHYGRPVLRKVREFVEIIVRSRDYPERGTAPAARGFVLGCEFKSIQIPVNSAWGRDVGTVGWMVPLWRPGTNPTVYPKPHITFRVAVAESAEDGGTGSQLVDIDTPERLVFFTSTEKGRGADTDKWPSYAGIDFPDVPKLQPTERGGIDIAEPDRRLPDPASVEPGLEAFTFGVVPGGRPIAIGAERGGKGVTAVIRNVSMARSVPRQTRSATTPSDEPAPRVVGAQEALRGVRENVEAAIVSARAAIVNELHKGGLRVDEVPARLEKAVADVLAGPIAALAKMPSPGGLSPCKVIKDQQKQVLDQSVARLGGLTDDLKQRLLAARAFLAGPSIDARKAFIASEIARLRDVAGVPAVASGALSATVSSVLAAIDRLETEVDAGLVSLEERARRSEAADAERLAEAIAAGARSVSALVADGAGIAAAVSGSTMPTLGELLRDMAATATMVAETFKMWALDIGVPQLGRARDQAALNQARADLVAMIAQLAADLQNLLRTLAQEVRERLWRIETEVDAALQLAGSASTSVLDVLEAKLNELLGKDPLGRDVATLLDEAFAAGALRLNLVVGQIRAEADAAVDRLCSVLGGDLGATFDQLARFRDGLADRLRQLLPTGALDLPAIEKALATFEAAVLGELGRIAGQTMGALDGVAKEIGASVEGAREALNRVGDDALRLLRAFGEPPRLPGLDFNRERIAYFFDELSDAIRITPSTALFDRLGTDLKGLGLRLPAVGIADQLLPPDLTGFDFSKILPDFAGLKLENLLPDLDLPRLPPDKIKVRHGIDTQSKRGWAEADIDIDIAGEKALFDYQPVKVQLVTPRFRAKTRTEQGVGGAGENRVRGQITGDWELVIAGFKIISFVDTPLSFDSERGVRFEVRPENVRMDSALQFLSDAMKGFDDGLESSGLSVEVMRRNGLPVGAMSRLSLPIPDIAAGTFAITNLHFGASFELVALPEFALTVRANLGRRTAPFNLTVFILGGGGWVEARATYLPLKNIIATELSVGITASAGLALALGPIRGSIMMYFGVYGEFYSDSGGGRTVTIGIMLLIVGQASLLGIVTVAVELLLEARYSEGGGLIGTGTLSYSVKIGWFFTLRVSAAVRYEFIKGSGTPPNRQRRLEKDFV